MKKVPLNILERYFALGMLREFKGAYDGLAFILEDIKQLPFSEKEKKELEMKEETVDDVDANGKPTKRGQVTWNPKKEKDKDVDFQDFVVKYLTEAIDKGEWTLADRAVVTLREKLK